MNKILFSILQLIFSTSLEQTKRIPVLEFVFTPFYIKQHKDVYYVGRVLI